MKTKKKILLVEDDLMVRETLVVILRNYYSVSFFSDPTAALSEILSGQKYEMLITDFDLKAGFELDGLTIGTSFRTTYSSAPMLLVTGSPLIEGRIQTFLDMPNTGLVEKPFNSETLLRAVEALLPA